MKIEMNVDLAVLYLTKKANKAELDEFNAWLKASIDNKDYYENWVELWEATGKTFEYINAETDKAWYFINKQTVSKKIEVDKQKNFALYILKVAAAAILLVSLGFVVFWLNKTGVLPSEHLITYSSGADTLTVQLSDGTRVCLNKFSIMLAPAVFKKHFRKVYFNGEAYFDIARDTTRPFKIMAKNTTTEVLGTSFDLIAKTHENITKLTLIKGKVALYKSGGSTEKLILLPGQQGIYNISLGVFRKEPIKNLNMLAWKTGSIQFNNAPLTEICKTLSAYYNTKIIYVERPNKIEQELFTGTFSKLSLEKAINIISSTLDVNIVKRKLHKNLLQIDT